MEPAVTRSSESTKKSTVEPAVDDELVTAATGTEPVPGADREIGWIRSVAPNQAEGRLARLYRQAVARAGKVFHVLRIQSLRPETLAASTNLYSEVMLSPRSPLTRAQREMIAVVVSRINRCHY